MKCSSLTLPVLTMGFLLGGGERASAQYSPYSPYSQPQVSPYLNILRGGGSPGMNYYGLVRPQLNYASGIAGLQQQNQQNQLLITGLQTTATAGALGPVTTGQPFGFMTNRSYFQNQFSGGQGGSGIGGQGGSGIAGQGNLGTGGTASFGLGATGGANRGVGGGRTAGRPGGG